ncbi:MAG: glycerol-3-phosphate 1-O-acyltransferase [Balneolaceae bacterium]|jgi:glycerol-3-phosphate acyltransferase PlsY|nr:MAG: glycerol-3-phosphate 1-O-acyltransferase [Balneolaceae bacterium]
MLSLIVIIVLSYIIGSIPTSLWVGRVYKKIDLREHGSGNLGATNTFRILGWKAGAVVSLIDFIKGFTAAFYLSQLGYLVGDIPVILSGWETDVFVRIVAGMFAVVGHMYPFLAGFKGGKGALTACGMLYGIEPISISLALVVFLIILFSTRYVSLASMISTLSYPLFLLILRYIIGVSYVDGSLIVITSVIAAGIVIKHHGNIKRLMEGTESRIQSFAPSKGRINEEKAT